jgi:hypothetical protein
MSENETTDPEITEPTPQEATDYAYGPGDQIFIHTNSGKYVAVVEKCFPDLRVAEASYDGSFQTITKRGPLYQKMAPHYLCFINNHGEKPIGASEPDTSLKVKSEDY